MAQVEVYTDEDGHIVLSQDDPLESESQIIALEADQVPTVIQWLQELLEEVKQQA